jgi:hypothetical protein
MEGRIDAVRCDDDTTLGDPVELDEVATRPLRDGEHAGSARHCARHDPAEHEPVAKRHQRPIALEREIVHRHHCGARTAQGQRVLRVHERRVGPAQRTGQRPGHPQLLRRRSQLDRLDTCR